MKKPVKRKLNVKKLFILLLFLYLIGYLGYHTYHKPIKSIILSGNLLVKDSDIIEIAGIKDYPSILSLRKKKLIKDIKKLDLIDEVKIKKDFKFRLFIDVKESKIVLHNSQNNKLMLSSGKIIDNDYKYAGIPTLINYAPIKILEEFVIKLGDLDPGIISLISEIEYSPRKNEEGKTIEENTFTLYMVDGNTVITNQSKCSNLKKYREIYASLKDIKGVLNLDSGNYENFIFIPYSEIEWIII